MTNKVMQCIEITKNTQILKIADFAVQSGLPTSEIKKNHRKNFAINRDLLNFGISIVHIR